MKLINTMILLLLIIHKMFSISFLKRNYANKIAVVRNEKTAFIEDQKNIILCKLVTKYTTAQLKDIEDGYIRAFKGEKNLHSIVDPFKEFIKYMKKNINDRKHGADVDNRDAIAYLILKMLDGDLIAGETFNSLVNLVHAVTDAESIKIAKDIVYITGGLGSPYYTYYLAYRYLEIKPFISGKCMGIKVQIEDSATGINFLERGKTQTKSWTGIKYYTFPLSPSKSSWGVGFKNMQQYLEETHECSKILIKPSEGSEDKQFPAGLDFKVSLKVCPVQIIGPSPPNLIQNKIVTTTHKNGDVKIYPISISNNIRSLNTLYNCHGWGHGLEEQLGPFTEKSINTLAEYIIYIKQLKSGIQILNNPPEIIGLLTFGNKLFLEKLHKDSFLYNFSMGDEDYLKKRLGVFKKKNKEKEDELKEFCPGPTKDIANGTLLLYASNGKMSHTAKYMYMPESATKNTWTSKTGDDELVTHGFNDLNGTTYGRAVFYICPIEINNDSFIPYTGLESF